tara:strand:+ start:9830 stop:10039 length:210 start_codon:yes stop_codon:yes gene_type:complete
MQSAQNVLTTVFTAPQGGNGSSEKRPISPRCCTVQKIGKPVSKRHSQRAITLHVEHRAMFALVRTNPLG